MAVAVDVPDRARFAVKVAGPDDREGVSLAEPDFEIAG